MRGIAFALAGAALVAGCATGQEAAVEEAADAFARALRSDDAQAACAALAPLTRQELESSEQQPCPEALAAQDLLRPSRFGAFDRFGREARVVVEGDEGRQDTWFLSRFDDRWLVVAAGCRPRGGQLPQQCDVEGA